MDEDMDRLVVALLRAALVDDREGGVALLAGVDPVVVCEELLSWLRVFQAREHEDAAVWARRLQTWRDQGARPEDRLAVEVLRAAAAGDGGALGGLLGAVTDRRAFVLELAGAFCRWEVYARGGDAAGFDAKLAEWQAATTGR